MRDSTKVAIGLGSIWGLYLFVFGLYGLLTMASAGYSLEGVFATLYGLTLLPCCLLAIWYRRKAALWLLVLGCLGLFNFAHRAFFIDRHQSVAEIAGQLLWSLLIFLVPAILGRALFNSKLPG